MIQWRIQLAEGLASLLAKHQGEKTQDEQKRVLAANIRVQGDQQCNTKQTSQGSYQPLRECASAQSNPL